MKLSRRTVLWGGLGAAGALVVGWGVLPPRSRIGQPDTLAPVQGEIGLNGWLKINADGQVLLAMPWAEMGQGVHTSLAMLVAEELDVAPEQVHYIPAARDSLYGNVQMLVGSLPIHPRSLEAGHQTTGAQFGVWMVSKVARELGMVVTGGSSTLADSWTVLPMAAASARAQLLAAAARRWQQPVDSLRIVAGVVQGADGKTAHFGELAADAAQHPVDGVSPKPRAQWAWIGKDQPRRDIPAKVNGTAGFGIDARPEGLLFASVRHAPALGGSLGADNRAELIGKNGVTQVVSLPALAGSTAGVAVVARSSWHAKQGALALKADAIARPGDALHSSQIVQALAERAQAADRDGQGFSFYSLGQGADALAGASSTLDAIYTAPYLAHATMEPMNCTARVADGRVEVWAPTQVPSMARAVAAKVAGVSEDAVTLHMTYLGGGFGRRLEVDSVAQAVTVALQTGGKPVQLLWTREEDFGHDFYRPAGVAVLRGGLDAQGQLTALTITSAGDAITPRWLERTKPILAGPVDTPDKTTAEGLFDLPYAVPHQRMRHVATHSGVPIGFWRSVGHSHNAFFSESFIDELAHAAKADPVQFRLGLLRDQPRYAAVLKLAAEQAGWGQALPEGRARGVALHESFGSIVAMVVEASRVDGQPKLHKVVCALDCGTVVNPAGVRQQVESSVVFGLSAALRGRIDIVDGVVQQRNFPDQMPLMLTEMPQVQTHLVASELPPTGMGEPALPPLAPALANALFALNGKRLRSLPLV
jgi:isoquinoline 1-oxidoreductase subunit beta